ncbi:MAG TPA: stress response translation initiation inhibitor YciH [Dehalococcoidia bacterium]|nr:stress response translation initiation inhibitor YciH [Dehalococcoidia bacterium]
MTMHNRRIVFSSDGGRVDRRKDAKANAPQPGFPDDGVVRLSREKGGRGGKTVTVVRGLPEADLEAQAADLKRLCGAGGTLRDGAIEIQGDHRERIAERLRGRGYTVKLAGG